MADNMQSVKDLMLTGMKYTLDFEQKASKVAEKMAEATQSPEAKEVFQQSVSKGQQYAERLQQAFQKVGSQATTEDNHIVDAMIKEVEGMIQSSQTGPIRDAALIVAANQMQHVRVANYGSLETYAKLIDQNEAGQLLRQNLDDSKGGDEKLTKIAEQTVNPAAKQASMQAA